MATIVECVEEQLVTVRIPDDVKQHVDKLVAEGRCTGCEKLIPIGEQVRLGQCVACYNKTLRILAKGKIKRNDLIRRGIMLAKGDTSSRPKGTFEKKLAEL